ncbi:2-amino-4-hydroxy-6-hydroxymethyldihydropteridine diphosphokinase [Noviherbaspirillum aridicola]|uniref:2-amino-4-hydroxy-6-hydroxymethyldihydropteridine pyrophosphokinase n=1 Tax=Noviherbaspirillum aridicola TaxID=2849687 RepID=A0ABQ4Q8J0_9BURK|nr:2-amino-4-hydroxy-6-hydroxymethyldihydropteridine diphosphokinase [Noviherbaspirillum aridicola]GIZ53227.1 2-amino-4-hydroxy-6-hydroxymethyldihydropteridine diphosphokinase [Noviherbaspirillum aridicola]
MTGGTTACYIGIGANLGDAQESVRLAVARLDKLPDTRLDACSSLFRTAPVDAGGDDYVNAVARIRTALEPPALLQALHDIEHEFGRERSFRNAPRTLDLDLLLYGARVLDLPDLTVPHPRMHERAFVLIPLLQLDPFIDIPGRGPAHAFAPAVAGQAIQKL